MRRGTGEQKGGRGIGGMWHSRVSECGSRGTVLQEPSNVPAWTPTIGTAGRWQCPTASSTIEGGNARKGRTGRKWVNSWCGDTKVSHALQQMLPLWQSRRPFGSSHALHAHAHAHAQRISRFLSSIPFLPGDKQPSYKTKQKSKVMCLAPAFVQ